MSAKRAVRVAQAQGRWIFVFTRELFCFMSDHILETDHLTKEFKGFTAVSNVNLAVRRGSIHALIGPNGAGKTTCFNLLTKFLEPTSGTIRFNGVDITREQPAQIARRGVIRSFQISAVFPHLSLMENVRLGLQRKLGTSFHFWRSETSLRQLNDRAVALLAEVGLDSMADEITVNLSYGRKRALEIATTLAMEPELMLLDEPTQGMGHEDVDRVTQLIKKVSAGRTILMVEHNMKVISSIADRITVLQRGALLAEGIGDTIRVSLSAPPVEEVKVGCKLLEYMGLRPRKFDIISCPSCGRAQVDVIQLASAVTEGLKDVTAPIRVAVMGCIVNGPGEAREADLGVASGNGKGQIFIKGKVIQTVPEDQIVETLLAKAQEIAAQMEADGQLPATATGPVVVPVTQNGNC